MSANGKDVVYVDVDDEITGIIDKVSSSTAKVVALVLPKRAAVFQSIVNMKLLKKRADATGKHVVLITSETGLMPLAGNVGIYVARTLTSKPEIPAGVSVASDADDEDIEEVGAQTEDFDSKAAGATAVGALVGAGATSINEADDDEVELDNSDVAADESKSATVKNAAELAAAGSAGKAAKKAKKDRHLNVPNFNRFRRLIIFGIVLIIALVAAAIYAYKVMPKALVTIHTDTSTVNASLDLSLDTSANTVDKNNNTVPAQTQQQQKSNTEQVAASGKKNLGNKATGSVTMTAQSCINSGNLNPPAVPAGTGLSANGLTFITQSDAQFNISGNTPQCVNYTSSPVDITAQNGGAQYNVSSGTAFTVAGQSGVTASGSTSGGTDNIVTIVQQSDIDSAKAKLKNDMNADAVKQQLEQQLQNGGLYPVETTFNASTPNVSPSVQPGAQADNVTVTESITYTMFGVKKSDVQQLLDASVNQQIDPSKQAILDDGLSQQSFNVQNPSPRSPLAVTLQTTATVGPHIDAGSLKAQIEGKKSGDVKSMIKALPGVTDVQVDYSPFFVTSAPSNPAKITINIEK